MFFEIDRFSFKMFKRKLYSAKKAYIFYLMNENGNNNLGKLKR